MQTRFLIIAAVMTTMSASAQEETDIIPKRAPGKNEMGLFVEPNLSGNYGFGAPGQYNGNLGVQYKRWVKPNIAYRVMGVIGEFNQNVYTSYRELKGDTLLQKQAYSHIPMYFLGGGVEVQRHFYKKVTLYAAIEIKGGYGTGSYQESLTKELQSQQTTYTPNRYFESVFTGSKSASAFVLDASPFIGAKLNFRRLCLGTEVSVVKLGVENVHFENTQSYGVANFDVGNFRQRLYLNYRF